MTLDDHVAALRDEADGDDGALAQATRLRLRRSLESGHAAHRRLAGVTAALAVLFVATASWALATGQLQKLWRRAEHVTPVRLRPGAAAPAPAPPAAPRHLAEAPPPLEPSQPLAPKPVHPAAPAPRPVEALYRKAHELHFHGSDPAAALAAWDAYLAAEPAGRFAVEARYNRALCLIRLGRLDDARDALVSFARGEVEPAGYRQDEAKALVDRIDARARD